MLVLEERVGEVSEGCLGQVAAFAVLPLLVLFVQVFPDRNCVTRLIGAVLLEQHEE